MALAAPASSVAMEASQLMKQLGESAGKASNDSRDGLVGFHGRRCDPQARDSTASFPSSVAFSARPVGNVRRAVLRQHARPWQDDLDHRPVLSAQDLPPTCPADPRPRPARTTLTTPTRPSRFWGDVVSAYTRTCLGQILPWQKQSHAKERQGGKWPRESRARIWF